MRRGERGKGEGKRRVVWEGRRKFLEVDSVPQKNQMKEEDHEGKGELQCRKSKK